MKNKTFRAIFFASLLTTLILVFFNFIILPAYAFFFENPEYAHAEIVVERPEQITDIKEYVLNEVEKHGLDKWEVYELIKCESNWNSEAVGVNSPNSIDYGLWQINHYWHSEISIIDKLDVVKATRWAIEKRLHDGNWSAWSCSRKLGIK